MNKKLKINEMKVKSFVTSVEHLKMNTCKGGRNGNDLVVRRTIESPFCYKDTEYPVCQWA